MTTRTTTIMQSTVAAFAITFIFEPDAKAAACPILPSLTWSSVDCNTGAGAVCTYTGGALKNVVCDLDTAGLEVLSTTDTWLDIDTRVYPAPATATEYVVIWGKDSSGNLFCCDAIDDLGSATFLNRITVHGVHDPDHYDDIDLSGFEPLVGGVVYGNEGDDLIHGTEKADELYGGQDHDQMYGSEGNDTMWGGNDDDYLHGEDGDDSLYAASSTDPTGVSGGNENWLYGGDGADHLIGSAENAPANHDYMYGGTADDTLEGLHGHDYLCGEVDEDSLYGGDGNDYVYGGVENDTVVDGGSHTGGAGIDRCDNDPGLVNCENNALVACPVSPTFPYFH